MTHGYDSRPDTYQHMALVRGHLLRCTQNLIQRAHDHDVSKLQSPELETYDGLTPALAGIAYGTPEYRAAMQPFKAGIKHHQQINDHHPEHFADGVRGMDLLQLLEMICDWKGAGQRQPDPDFRAAIDIQVQRFGIGDELRQILLNTADTLAALESRSP